MKKILVLGSSGRLGQAIKHLVSLGEITESEIRFPDRGSVDLLDAEATKAYFYSYRPDVVLNLAARVRPQLDVRSGDDDVFASNLKLVQNIYAAGKSAGIQCLIQASSYHMFASTVSRPFPSHSPPGIAELNFDSPYAAAKSTEYLFSYVANDNQETSLNVKIVVMPNLFGPFGPALVNSEHFVGATIRRMFDAVDQNVDLLEAHGNQQQMREYLFTLDAAAQLLNHLRTHSDLSTYSVISSGTRLTQKECWDMIAEATGYSGRTKFVPSSASAIDMYFDQATFEPTSFKDALATTVSWYAKRKARVREND